MTEFHARLVDFTEHPLVLLVDDEGNGELIGEDSFCAIRVAALLRLIAADLLASHPLGPCAPQAEATVWERPAEPLHPQGSTLDRVRQLWTDGTGHVWDLSVKWGDASGRPWRWTGELDRVTGVPLMRCEYRPDTQPLDVLRATCGPIAPMGGAR